MLSGGTQRRTLPRYQSEGMKILSVLFLRVRIKLTNCHEWPQNDNYERNKEGKFSLPNIGR